MPLTARDGRVQPSGRGAGLQRTDAELRDLTSKGCLHKVPLKAGEGPRCSQMLPAVQKSEHCGQHIGRVVSSFVDSSGRLKRVMRIADDKTLSMSRGRNSV